MTNIPFLDIASQDREILPLIQQKIGDVIELSSFSGGKFVDEFEDKFAEYCGAKYCVAVNSGTSALHLALLSAGVGEGDEVVTVPNSFVATSWAISYVGATPVYVDIDPSTHLMDISQITSKVSKRTKAIMPVHLYGNVVDVQNLKRVLTAYGIDVPIIEDAAQAHGATLFGKPVGSFGNLSCFSFYPGKNLGAYGEGGAVLTDCIDQANLLRKLRNHAQPERYVHEQIGFNYRMDGIQAAVLSVKLDRLEQNIRNRQRAAKQYNARLSQLKQLSVVSVSAGAQSSYHLYVVFLSHRDKLKSYLKDNSIATGLHYPLPIHLQKAYQHLNFGRGAFPVAEQSASNCLSLPLFPTITKSQVDEVCDHVLAFLKEKQN